MESRDFLTGLTKSQKEAVTYVDGPVLVVAGAGTGKTTVITKRIAWLIAEKRAKPEEILALTFTEKAATEMLTRVDELSDYIYSGLAISTFHSFGSDIINEFSFELGLPADVRVLTDVEQVLFMRDHIFDFEFNHYQNLGDPTSLIRELVKTFSRLKDEAIDPDDFIKVSEKNIKKVNGEAEKEEAEKHLEIARAYEKYNQLLRSEGYIDYGDQLNLVLELLKKPSVAKKIRNRYKFALVDEFQDTNYVQSKLIMEIFGKSGNVMVVGDDDQSIYKFRGASVSNILNFRDQYQNVKTIVLSDNFRSTQPILDATYELIQKNNPNRLEAKYGIDKKLKSHILGGDDPKVMLLETESQEAEMVAQKIIERNKKGIPFSEIAILFRANRHGDEFVRTLSKHGIPFTYSGAAGLYEKMEVKMLVSLISVLSNPSDNLALFHLAQSDVYNMNSDDLAHILRWSRERNKNLTTVFADLFPLVESLGIFPETASLGLKIIENLSELREESKTATAGEVVNLFLKQSGYYGKLTREAQKGSIEAHQKITNIASFFDKIIHFQRNYKDHSLEKFANYLELVLEAGDDPKSAEPAEALDAVSVLTVHKSKGLEFDTVFVSSLSDSHFPGNDRKDKLPFPSELLSEVPQEVSGTEEERRLFYVACTRAKKNLFLTAALDYGTKRTHKVSRFVTEMLGREAIEQRFLKTEAIERIKHFEKVPALYGVALDLIPESEKIVLSRAAIDDWLTCPFKYQLIHVTPIRIVADSNVAYGNAIHNAIGEYYKRRLGGAKVKKSEILEWFDLFWDEAGFLSRVHEKKRYSHGKKALSDFYLRAEKEALPKFIEKEFKIQIGNNIIKGRYDAVFEDKKNTEIVDFKTSSVKTQEKADDRTAKSSQLAMYALAWQKTTQKLPDKVKLYFIDTGIQGSFVPTEKSVEKTIKEIEKATEGIRARNFEATPKFDKCPYCPFKFYCPVAIVGKVSS
jgi:DNA helicase-2/ATP-dependent DNA helicase PcrA